MPRIKAIRIGSLGFAPVLAADCPSCGARAGEICYLQCPRSPLWQSPEQERDEALATEQEIAAVGFMAWDSAQHRRHGLPCPYDGYDPADADEVYVGLGEIDASNGDVPAYDELDPEDVPF